MQREYPRYPILGVGGVVFLEDQVVLIKRGREPGYGTWNIPGGAVKLGETIQDAVKREIYEETDLHVDVLDIVKVLEPIIRDDADRIKYHYVIVDFLCEYISGKPRADSDVLDALAVPLSELPGYDLSEVTLKVIEKASNLLKNRI